MDILYKIFTTMIYNRKDIEKKESNILAPYACQSQRSLGRAFPETEDPYRTCFQRDRDRIIHSKSFRRLKGKTQVFVSHHGDHYRSRLTHTMEVAQISRDMSRNLGLNEDLSESIALAHDLGHTPFGHAGEYALNQKMKEYQSSFEHNQQSLRVVCHLEKRSPDYEGLNLSQEIIIGMGKHNNTNNSLPYLEAQVVDLADEIAYLHHDIDDGIRSGILKISDFSFLQKWESMKSLLCLEDNPELWLIKFQGKFLNTLISNVYTETENNINNNNIQTLSDIQTHTKRIISFDSVLFKQIQELRKFLFANLYKFQTVESMNQKGKKIISELFDYFYNNIENIPQEYRDFTKQHNKHEIICDYIAGMTDSFAEKVYKTL